MPPSPPHVSPPLSALIIGTGFAGLGMAIRLKSAGIHDFTVLESAPSVGGTWRDNRYPGAACDIPSYLYSFSFEPNPRWSRSFSGQAEILAYLEHCADKYELGPHLRFNATVTRAVFDERAGVWDVTTEDGKTYRARALVSGCGGLSRPSYPDIPGLADFQGKVFHSARWDTSFPLDGKTVGVIGTGASGIQIVPEIAPTVGKLHVFQRTPPWIVPKPDVAIPPRVQTVFRRAAPLQQLARAAIYCLLEWRAYAMTLKPALMKKSQDQALRFLARKVKDPELRAKLTPAYTMGCKRILLSNDYFDAIQRPNVDVVTDGIERITAKGVVTRDGTERPLDALVLATGFQAAEAVAPFEIRGKAGRSLNDAWKDSAEAYLGTTISGFPNLFFIIGPNTGLGHNSLVYIIESQIQYVLDAIRTMKAKRLATVEVRADVQRRYNEDLQARMAKTVWSTGGCKAWYTTRDGKNTTLWPGFTFEYRFRTRRFDTAQYDLVPEKKPSRNNGIAEHVPGHAAPASISPGE